MKQVKLFFATTLLAACFVITNSCSQTPLSVSSSFSEVFEASTPCNDVSKTLFGMPSDTKCELMKWNLTLYQDPKTLAPSTYKLICVYGLPKQGTKGFMEGAKTMELNGKWTIVKGINESAGETVKLNADNSSISLSLLKPDQNLLHLLDGNNHLMVGNGAWSYTLNRINPVIASPAKFTSPTTSSTRLATDSATVGIFDGRTSCHSVLRELNGISAGGCQRTKWRLTLYQDPKTHSPTTFQLKTVYVGKGDSSYTNTGKWIVTQGTKTNPTAIVYQLQLDSDKPLESLAFLKADDNILFFLDENKSVMVGNAEFNYTLNRIK